MVAVSGATDGALARLAGPLRVLTTEDLLRIGLGYEAIRVRVAQERLQRLWRGVYFVGPGPIPARSLAKAAVASFSARVYISHEWAAFLHGFAPAPERPVDIVVPGAARVRSKGIRVHRSRTLEPRDLTERWRIPVTSAARAILDTADTATVHQVERFVADAQVAKAVTDAQLRDVLNRAGRRRAATVLRKALSDTNGMTLSEAERILRRLLHQAGLPQPITNYPIGRFKADFCWPDHKLIVEFDSYTHHSHRHAFHHDRRRNAILTVHWSVMQVTWDQLEHEPLAVVARIAAALATRAA